MPISPVFPDAQILYSNDYSAPEYDSVNCSSSSLMSISIYILNANLSKNVYIIFALLYAIKFIYFQWIIINIVVIIINIIILIIIIIIINNIYNSYRYPVPNLRYFGLLIIYQPLPVAQRHSAFFSSHELFQVAQLLAYSLYHVQANSLYKKDSRNYY